MVSPIPWCRRIDRADVVTTMPFCPIPASVRPKCRGMSVSSDMAPYASTIWFRRDTLQDMIIMFSGSPMSMAVSALAIALSTNAWRSTASASNGSGSLEFVSILSASSSWSRLPALTPIRTGLPRSFAILMNVLKFSSCLFPLPMLPGFMRNFARVLAHWMCSLNKRCPIK